MDQQQPDMSSMAQQQSELNSMAQQQSELDSMAQQQSVMNSMDQQQQPDVNSMHHQPIEIHISDGDPNNYPAAVAANETAVATVVDSDDEAEKMLEAMANDESVVMDHTNSFSNTTTTSTNMNNTNATSNTTTTSINHNNTTNSANNSTINNNARDTKDKDNDQKRSQFSTKQRMDMYAFCVMELELNSHKVSMKKQHEAMKKAIGEKHENEWRYIQQQRSNLHKQQMLKHQMEMNFRRVKYLQKLQTPQPLLQPVSRPTNQFSSNKSTPSTFAVGTRALQPRIAQQHHQQQQQQHQQQQSAAQQQPLSQQYRRFGQPQQKQIIVVVNGPPPQSPEQMQQHVQQLLLQHPEVQKVMQANPQSQIHFQLKFQPQLTPSSKSLTPKNPNQTIIVIEDSSTMLANNQPLASTNNTTNNTTTSTGTTDIVERTQEQPVATIEQQAEGQEISIIEQHQVTDQSFMETADREQEVMVPTTSTSHAPDGSLNSRDTEVKPRALSCYSDFQRAQVLTTGMLKNVQDRYSTYYPDGPTPSRTTIKHVFERCVTLGTVENKTRTRKSTKLPMGDEIEYLLIHEPQLSLRQLAQKLNVSTGTVSRRCKQLGLVPESVTIKQHQLQTARRQKQMKQLETISKTLG